MKAAASTEEQNTKDTAVIVGDAHGRLRRYCWVKKDEVHRLDELSRKLRSLNGENTGRVQRPVLLSELLLSGLELAESKTQPLDIFRGLGARAEFPLAVKDADRVKSLARSLWPVSKERPTIDDIQGAMIRLALQAAEKEALQVAEKESDFLSNLASRVLPTPDAAKDSTSKAYYGSDTARVIRGPLPASAAANDGTLKAYYGNSIPREIRDQLKALVLELRPLLGKTLTQVELIRTALAEWLLDIDPNSPAVVKAVLDEHRRYSPSRRYDTGDRTPLVRVVVVIPLAMMERIDKLAFDIGPLDYREVARSTLVRVALAVWLRRASADSPAVVEAVRRQILPNPPREEVV